MTVKSHSWVAVSVSLGTDKGWHLDPLVVLLPRLFAGKAFIPVFFAHLYPTLQSWSPGDGFLTWRHWCCSALGFSCRRLYSVGEVGQLVMHPQVAHCTKDPSGCVQGPSFIEIMDIVTILLSLDLSICHISLSSFWTTSCVVYDCTNLI